MELQHELASSTSGERSTNAAVSDLERHFTVAELSKRWFFSENTIRRPSAKSPEWLRSHVRTPGRKEDIPPCGFPSGLLSEYTGDCRGSPE